MTPSSRQATTTETRNRSRKHLETESESESDRITSDWIVPAAAAAAAAHSTLKQINEYECAWHEYPL